MSDPQVVALPAAVIVIFLAAALAFAAGRLPATRRPSTLALGWLLAAAPAGVFTLLLSQLPAVLDAGALTWRVNWLPDLGLRLGFYLDSLATFFALIVSGIGVLIVIYAGYYFKEDGEAWRFLTYILLFMGSMLGLVLAGDILTLFVFWEGTSVTSFLLVAYKYKYEDARRGAFKAFFITGAGGIALLFGLLLISSAAGSTEFAAILQSGEALRESPFYLLMIGLIAVGAMTKSAQWPFHIWLPDAMSAPTPASAYLHSATMVKAGIFLLARLNPVLGLTETWFWLFTIVGMITMLVGAIAGVRQNDLKALLAYSTVSQLGILVMLIGQDTEIAFKALVIGVIAHALYKSALFLLVGIVDHESGTRDLRRLGGLRRAMPITFTLVSIAALSMAGLPPLFGFLAKETLLATAVHPSLPLFVSWILAGAVVVAAAFKLVQSGLLIFDGFTGEQRDPTLTPHEPARLMLLMPAIPALLSLAIGLLPEPPALATFFGAAAANAFGDEVKVSFALWTGLNIPLGLSVLAIAAGSVLTWYRGPLRRRMAAGDPLANFSLNRAFTGLLAGIDWAAYLATRMQYGKLRTYLSVIILSMVLLVFLFGGLAWPTQLGVVDRPAASLFGATSIMRIFALLAIISTTLVSVILRRDSFAIFAIGVSGLGVAVYMVLEPAPDVALVQVVVDILAMVILVLALVRLPREQRRRAQEVTFLQSRMGLVRDIVVAAAGGLVMTILAYGALISRPRTSALTPYFEENAKPLAGATDIVGAIIVDFRALDTLIEIAVFSMAGLGVYALLRHAAKKYGDDKILAQESASPAASETRFQGFGTGRASSFLRALAQLALPLSMVIAMIHMMYGHDQPGDGFTAGVIVSLAVGFWYIIFGYEDTRRRLVWLRPGPLIAGGLLLAIVTATVAAWMTGSFFAHVNFGGLMGLPLPTGFSFSTAFLFEVAIGLAVLGSVSFMIDTLGHVQPASPAEQLSGD